MKKIFIISLVLIMTYCLLGAVNGVVFPSKVDGVSNPTSINNVSLFYGPTWTYNPSTGVWTNVLTVANGGLGPELLSNGNFAAWAGLADPNNYPTGWTLANNNATNYVQNNSGARLVSDNNTVLQIFQTTATPANVWVKANFDLTIALNGARLTFGQTIKSNENLTVAGNITRVTRTTGAAQFGVARYAGAAADATWNNCTLRQFTTADLFLTKIVASGNSIGADIEPAISNAGGVVRWLDSRSNPLYYCLAWHDGTNIHLDTVANGAYVSLINTPAAPSGGYDTIAIKGADAAHAELWFRGSQVDVTKDASAVIGPGGVGSYGGIFSTGAAKNITTQ